MRRATIPQRIISIAMSASLVVGMCPMPALAADADSEEAVVVEEAASQEEEELDGADPALDQVAEGEEAATAGEDDENATEAPDEDATSADGAVESKDGDAEDDAVAGAEPELIAQQDEAIDGTEPGDNLEATGTESTTGSCGAKATWSYDAESKTLTIAGTGAMSDYEGVLNGEERPWDGFDIDEIIIKDGITYIGKCAFRGLNSITIEIPASVTSIGEDGISTVTVRAYDGTYAEEYANDLGLTFESLGKLEIDLATCDVTLDQTEYAYTGDEIKPQITVVHGDKELVPGTDYTYKYENNLLPGEATVTINAKADSDYVGSTTATFTILQLENKVSFKKKTTTVKASTAAQTVDAKATATGGTIAYASSNSNVKVSKDGAVTIPAWFAGTVTITATATDPDGIYAKASEKMTITVNTIDNKITTSAGSYTKTVSASAQTFSLGTKRNGSGKISYKSSTSYVKVASDGKVTIVRNYVGKATITISVAKQGIYNAATKTVTVTVNPARVVLSRVVNTAVNRATVTWRKTAGAGGYQIQYSVYKNFSTAGTVNVASGNTLTRALTSLVKGRRYYVRVRAFRKASGTTLYGAWSAPKVVAISKGNALTLKGAPRVTSSKQVQGKEQRDVRFTAVSGASGYEVFYRVKKGSVIYPWKSAGKTTSRSKVINVMHGRTTFYSFKVRAYKKRADGTVLYSNFSAETRGEALYITPSVSTFMLDETKTSTTSVAIYVMNNGSLPLRIYSKNAKLIDRDYTSYDRNLKLVDTDALKRNMMRYKSYIDIPAGTSMTLAFHVPTGNATWYDKKSTLRFDVGYDGGSYTFFASSYYGTRYYEN